MPARWLVPIICALSVACVPDYAPLEAPPGFDDAEPRVLLDAGAPEDAIVAADAEEPAPPPDAGDPIDARALDPDASDSDAAEVAPDAEAPPFDAGSDEPDTSQLGDTPYFRTGAELCDYVNQSRLDSSGHERFRGGANAGYHNTRTWPVVFTIDPLLMTEARAEALRLEGGGGITGTAHGDGFRYRRIYADGVNTASYQVTALDEAGDWNVSYFKSGLIDAAAAARQYLYYHDPGGSGPVLRTMGCAGANAPSGGVYWVVLLRP